MNLLPSNYYYSYFQLALIRYLDDFLDDFEEYVSLKRLRLDQLVITFLQFLNFISLLHYAIFLFQFDCLVV